MRAPIAELRTPKLPPRHRHLNRWTSLIPGPAGINDVQPPTPATRYTSLVSNPGDRQQIHYGPLISHANAAIRTAGRHGLRDLKEFTTFNLPPLQRECTNLVSNPGDRQQIHYGPLTSHASAAIRPAERHGLRGLLELTTFNLPPLQREYTNLVSNPGDRQQVNYGPLISHASAAIRATERPGLLHIPAHRDRPFRLNVTACSGLT